MESTSFHSVNADKGLNRLHKLLWLLNNLFENCISGIIPFGRIKITHFSFNPEKINTYNVIGARKNQSSPTRLFNDIFWNELDFSEIKSELQNRLDAIEIGCGHGIYGDFLSSRLDEDFSYMGIDPMESNNWDVLSNNKNLTFVKDSSEAITKYLNNKNFIFTQSAIEHFDNDLKFFRDLAKYVNECPYSTYQIHTFPSSLSIFSYPLHGIRQYNMKNIKKICNLFPKSKLELIALGSISSVFFHFKVITLPRLLGKSDLRVSNNDQYLKGLSDAVKKDLRKPKKNLASFYALIIKTTK